jgi:hypothetical protein
MQAETIAGQLPAGQRTPNIHEAGASPGLSVEEGRELAVSMQDVGWAVLNFANNSMRLTEAGRRAVGRLSRPRLLRWSDDHAACTAAPVSLAVGLLLKAVDWLLK